MQTLSVPLQIVCDSAHELFIQVLQAFEEAEVVPSVQDPKSVGSCWGMRERPTKELRYVTLVLENPRNRCIDAPMSLLEDVVPRALLCTLCDEIDVPSIAFYNPKALDFSDDGKIVDSNYGYRIRHLNGVNQIEGVIAQLRKDPSSRRAVIHVHAVGDSEKKYTPCIDSLHFLIREGVLECQTFWRSENGLTLLPTNLFEFTMLHELIASELGVPVGRYVQSVTSLHYYLEDGQKLQQTVEMLLSKQAPEPMPPMPFCSLEEVETLRSFERKLRLQEEEPQKEFFALSDYWKGVGCAIARGIVKRRKDSAPMPLWLEPVIRTF
jgi:thymidylate synthase